MLKKIVFLFLVLLSPLALFGQKKQIAQANEYIKSHKNLDKAEKVLSVRGAKRNVEKVR